jgi:hypothetical protein
MSKNIKEWLESRVNVIIERHEKDIEKYTDCFNEDYDYFFRWYAEAMYKSQMEYKELCALRSIIKESGIDEIEKAIETRRYNLEHDLLECSLKCRSTSEAMNVAHVWMIEEKQDLRNMYCRFLSEIAEGKKIEG